MKKAIEIKAPNHYELGQGYATVFLAGSIENGVAEQWQERVVADLADSPIRFLNPRRDDWNPEWNDEEHRDKLEEQILWELEGLELADLIIAYIDPNTKSPITLLEIGIHSHSGKLIVLCPEGFYRKVNVDVTCDFYEINQVDTYEELINFVKSHF
jgi:hypothetical protein